MAEVSQERARNRQRRILDAVGMTDSNVLHSAAGEGAKAALQCYKWLNSN